MPLFLVSCNSVQGSTHPAVINQQSFAHIHDCSDVVDSVPVHVEPHGSSAASTVMRFWSKRDRVWDGLATHRVEGNNANIQKAVENRTGVSRVFQQCCTAGQR